MTEEKNLKEFKDFHVKYSIDADDLVEIFSIPYERSCDLIYHDGIPTDEEYQRITDGIRLIEKFLNVTKSYLHEIIN